MFFEPYNSSKVDSHRTWIAFYSMFVFFLPGSAVDIYVPSLPAMVNYFHSSATMIQLTVGVYLFAYGVSQIVFGPLSDAYGRKPVIVFGLLLSLIISFLLTFSPNVEVLLFCRFIQGVCIAAVGAASRAIPPEVFSGMTYKKVSTYVTIAWALGPVASPYIGSYLQHFFGWYAPFWGLGVLSAILLLIAITKLPETREHRGKVGLRVLGRNFKTALTHPIFMSLTLACSLIYMALIIFNVLGPFLIQVLLKKSVIYYGRIALLMGLAWLLGNIANRILVHQSAKKRIEFSLYMVSIAVLTGLMLAFAGILSVSTIVCPIFIIMFFSSIIFSNTYMMSMASLSEHPGISSAIVGTMGGTAAGISAAIASLLKTHTQLPMFIMYSILVALILCVYCLVIRREKNVWN